MIELTTDSGTDRENRYYGKEYTSLFCNLIKYNFVIITYCRIFDFFYSLCAVEVYVSSLSSAVLISLMNQLKMMMTLYLI